MQTNNMPSLQPPWPEETIYASSGGTSLVFDKSALESLNIHEAALAEEVAGCAAKWSYKTTAVSRIIFGGLRNAFY
jgi:hypothetical protein